MVVVAPDLDVHAVVSVEFVDGGDADIVLVLLAGGGSELVDAPGLVAVAELVQLRQGLLKLPGKARAFATSTVKSK
eukprot:scaffold52706_cov26-Prasinocladus_malaysianus.AAC.1